MGHSGLCARGNLIDFRASAKNKYTIWLVLWPVYCVASTGTYPLICTGGCALPDLIKTGEPKSGAILHIYFLPRPLSFARLGNMKGKRRLYAFGISLFTAGSKHVVTHTGFLPLSSCFSSCRRHEVSMRRLNDRRVDWWTLASVPWQATPESGFPNLSFFYYWIYFS